MGDDSPTMTEGQVEADCDRDEHCHQNGTLDGPAPDVPGPARTRFLSAPPAMAASTVGSAGAANATGYSNYATQRRYDNAFVQCMYAKGNQVPVRAGYRSGMPLNNALPAGAPTG